MLTADETEQHDDDKPDKGRSCNCNDPPKHCGEQEDAKEPTFAVTGNGLISPDTVCERYPSDSSSRYCAEEVPRSKQGNSKRLVVHAVCALTLALSGTQHAPRSGNLLLRVRDEQPVSR